MAINPLQPEPSGSNLIVMDSSDAQFGKCTYDWDRFFDNTYSTVNTLVEMASSANLMLNSTFHFQDGVTTPVTESDGDDAFVSEKWQVRGSSNADYTIDAVPYSLTDSHVTNSSNYTALNITNYNGGDLYLYQQFEGLQHVRMLQGKTLSFSGVFNNILGDNVSVQFGVYRFYDPESSLNTSTSLLLKPGLNYVSASIDIPRSTETLGPSPVLEIRVYIKRFVNNSNISIHYIKAEFGKYSTVNVIDNFIERTRINNS